MTSSTGRNDPGKGWIASHRSQNLARAFGRVTAQAWEPIAFSLSLNGPLCDRLRAWPRNPQQGDVERGRDLIEGRYVLSGGSLDIRRGQPWKASDAMTLRFREALHGFAWLADLAALGRSEGNLHLIAGEKSRALISGWLGAHAAFSEPAWRPDIVGRRIISWLCEAPMLTENTDLVWRSRFHYSLGCQARYLFQTAEHAPGGEGRLTALIGLQLACLALGNAGPRRHRASARLLRELEAQTEAAGTFGSFAHMSLRCDLQILRSAFIQSNTPMEQPLEEIIGRLSGA